MHHPARPHLRRRRVACAIGACLTAALLAPGCETTKPKANTAVKITYPTLAPKSDVPEFVKGSVWELTERTNDEPYATASYGLVARLRGTGDSTVSLPVRQWMIKQMTRHQYGSRLLDEYKNIGAETILTDPHYAIVRVDGMIPPGARAGDFFDVNVSALPGNKTSSLSGGLLFESDLYRIRGSSPDLEGVEIFAKSRGPIVVNPAYALNDPGTETSGQAKASLRSGVIIGGGRAMRDRPIVLRLRSPARPMARAIENRINQRFQKYADKARTNVVPVNFQVAAALDEGVVEVYVPKKYPGDWRHFIGVCEQLYVNTAPGFAVGKARQLAEEAVKPEAPLEEISHALEGIGEPALQYTLPLMAHAKPDVAFAMARASAYIPDNSGAAQAVLLRIAASDDNPFQLAAIETLGELPYSPERNQKLRPLLDSKNTLARTAVFKVLVRNNEDPTVYTRWVKDPRDNRKDDERHEKFALDVVPAGGEPLVHATRSGIPRISLIGPKPQLQLPIVFTTMGGRLMISSPNVGRTVTLFYRDDARKEPLKMVSRPDLAEVIARLGGEGAPTEEKFDFTYGEIVAVVQELSQQKLITASRGDGRLTLAPFVLEQPGDTQDVIDTAPVIEDSRPNTGDAVMRDIDGGKSKEPNAAG